MSDIKNTSTKKNEGKYNWKFLEKTLTWALVGMFVLVILSIICALFLYFFNFPFNFSKSHEVWAQFGDYIGGTLNSILGFASFIALLITIIFQRQEISLTREELELTRDELAKSARAQELSAEVASAQMKHLQQQNITENYFKHLEYFTSLMQESYNSSDYLVSITKVQTKHLLDTVFPNLKNSGSFNLGTEVIELHSSVESLDSLPINSKDERRKYINLAVILALQFTYVVPDQNNYSLIEKLRHWTDGDGSEDLLASELFTFINEASTYIYSALRYADQTDTRNYPYFSRLSKIRVSYKADSKSLAIWILEGPSA